MSPFVALRPTDISKHAGNQEAPSGPRNPASPLREARPFRDATVIQPAVLLSMSLARSEFWPPRSCRVNMDPVVCSGVALSQHLALLYTCLLPELLPPRHESFHGFAGGSSGCLRRKLSFPAVHQFEAARPFSFCEEVPYVAVPVLFQRARECRPLPKAATDFLIPCFCQNPTESPQATSGTDIGTGRPRTCDH